MTQPPDDAALVARLREEALQLHSTAWSRMDGGQDCSISAALAEEAATALEAKDRRIAEMRMIVEAIAEADGDDCVGSVTVDIPHEGWARQWIRDAAKRLLSRAALEPSDKGVGR